MIDSFKARAWFFKLVLPVVVGLLCAKASELLLRSDRSLNGLEFRAQQSSAGPGHRATPSGVIRLITIQEATRSKLKLPPEYRGVPRHLYGEMLLGLDRAGALAALVDIAFKDPDPHEDPQLTADLKQLKRMKVTLDTLHSEDGPEDSPSHGHPIPQGWGGLVLDSAVWPIGARGPVRVEPTANEVIGASDELIGGYAEQSDTIRNLQFVHGALSAVLQAENEDQLPVTHDIDAHRLRVGTHQWNLNLNQAIPIDWTTGGSPFKTYEYGDVLAHLSDAKYMSDFKDKIVVIGASYGGDHHNTAPFGDMPGVEIMAQLVNTILEPFDEERWFDKYNLLYCFAFAAVAFRLAMNPVALRAVLGIVATTLAALGCYWVAHAFSKDAPLVVHPILAIVLASPIALLIGRLPFVRTDLRQAGVEYQATVMFLDLVASTPLLHDMGAGGFSTMISGLQTDMARIVTRSGGEFERTTGDGFIAVFPSQGQPHHALQALESIPKLRQAFHWAGNKFGRDLRFTMGVETGMVTGAYVREGNLRMWSSAGRTVVLAQRLQSLCKKLEVEVAVGPVTQKLCEEKFDFRLVGTEVPKGFPDEVQIFTI